MQDATTPSNSRKKKRLQIEKLDYIITWSRFISASKDCGYLDFKRVV